MSRGVLPALRASVDAATGVCHVASLAILVGIVLLVNADMAGRVMLNAPVAGTAELMGQGVVAFAFLQLPNAFRRNRLLRAEGAYRALMRRSRRAATILRLMLHLLAIAIALPLLFYSLPMLLRDWTSGDYVGALGVVTVPVWPTRMAVVVGITLLTLQIGFSALGREGEGTEPPVSL